MPLPPPSHPPTLTSNVWVDVGQDISTVIFSGLYTLKSTSTTRYMLGVIPRRNGQDWPLFSGVSPTWWVRTVTSWYLLWYDPRYCHDVKQQPCSQPTNDKKPTTHILLPLTAPISTSFSRSAGPGRWCSPWWMCIASVHNQQWPSTPGRCCVARIGPT